MRKIADEVTGDDDLEVAVEPEYHIWNESRIPWFDTVDDLPRYEDDGPDRNIP